MKKNSLSLLVVAFSMLFVGAGCSYEASVGDVQELSDFQTFEYSSPDSSFSISGKYPKGWTEDRTVDSSTLTMLFSDFPEGDDFRENVNIVRFQFAPEEVDMSVDEYADSALEGSDEVKGYKFVSRIKGTVSGFPAVTNAYQTTEYNDGAVIQFTQTIVKTNNSGYLITFTGTPEGIKKYQKVYDDFLKSIIIK